MRIVFVGTPAVAVPVLRALLEAGHDLAGVVTQPDKPAGRGRQDQVSPVKSCALECDLPVLQPASFRTPGAVAELAALAPQLLVVAAYGKLLPPSVLGIPPLGTLNLHPSLLPRHRGPSPVASAILEGDKVTGVTIMLLDEGMDTGPILAQEVMGPIGPQETTESLTPLLFRQGARLLVESLERWARGELSPVAQDDSRATVSRRIMKEDGRLDFTLPARQLGAQVRAYQPWPGAYTSWQGSLLKLLEVVVLPQAPSSGPADPGRVLLLPSEAEAPVAVATGEGLLGLRRLQLEGKRTILAGEFLRGYPAFPGARLPS